MKGKRSRYGQFQVLRFIQNPFKIVLFHLRDWTYDTLRQQLNDHQGVPQRNIATPLLSLHRESEILNDTREKLDTYCQPKLNEQKFRLPS